MLLSGFFVFISNRDSHLVVLSSQQIMTALLFALFLLVVQKCYAESILANSTHSLALPAPTSLSSQPNDPFWYPSHELGAVVVEHQRKDYLPVSPLLQFILSCAQTLDKLERTSHSDLQKPIPGGFFWCGEEEHGFRFLMHKTYSDQLLFWHVYRVIEVLRIWARQWDAKYWKPAEVRYMSPAGILVGRGLIGSKRVVEEFESI